jgi:hypothetical protein
VAHCPDRSVESGLAIPEAPGALAYHFVQPDGVPAGKIGVETTLNAGETVASATSHEAVELQCDIFL